MYSGIRPTHPDQVDQIGRIDSGLLRSTGIDICDSEFDGRDNILMNCEEFLLESEANRKKLLNTSRVQTQEDLAGKIVKKCHKVQKLIKDNLRE